MLGLVESWCKSGKWKRANQEVGHGRKRRGREDGWEGWKTIKGEASLSDSLDWRWRHRKSWHHFCTSLKRPSYKDFRCLCRGTPCQELETRVGFPHGVHFPWNSFSRVYTANWLLMQVSSSSRSSHYSSPPWLSIAQIPCHLFCLHTRCGKSARTEKDERQTTDD